MDDRKPSGSVEQLKQHIVAVLPPPDRPGGNPTQDVLTANFTAQLKRGAILGGPVVNGMPWDEPIDCRGAGPHIYG